MPFLCKQVLQIGQIQMTIIKDKVGCVLVSIVLITFNIIIACTVGITLRTTKLKSK